MLFILYSLKINFIKHLGFFCFINVISTFNYNLIPTSNKMKKNLYFLFTVFYLACPLLIAQAPSKLGAVDKAEFEKNYSNQFPDAEAIVLFDYGIIYFDYNSLKGFQVKLERHTRIKILNQNGLKWGDGEISLYQQKSETETVSKLKGFTYNLENGKIERAKLESPAIFQDRISENYIDVRFAMPNVRVGSIIEYSYTLTSDFLNILPSWNFQMSVPVLHSEIITKIPEYFNYKTLMKGYEIPEINEKTTGSQGIIITIPGTANDPSGRVAGKSPDRTERINARILINRLASSGIPAFIEEPYLASAKDYMSGVEFELSSVNFPGQFAENISDTWEGITKNLLESELFGKQLNRSGFLNSVVESIIDSSAGEYDKMAQAHATILNKMRWDERNRVYATRSLRDAFNEGVGSSGDINLLLVLLLRELGLESNPVLISTRENGMVHPARVMLSQFNYVIAHVRLDSIDYLLDATDKNCPLFLLPVRCLNGKGRLITDNSSSWIDLESRQNYQWLSIVNYKIDEERKLTGTIQNQAKNYAAYQKKSALSNDPEYKKYISSLENRFPGAKVLDYSIENLDNLIIGVKENIEMTISDAINSSGNLLFFNPILHARIDKNPFRLEERKYPVDYGYLLNETFIFNFEIPQGYSVDEIPANIQIILPDNSASFSYQVSVFMNKIQVQTKFQINKTTFIHSDYKNLKEFYDIVVNKHSEQIVLKET
jgi:hypothetical protein